MNAFWGSGARHDVRANLRRNEKWRVPTTDFIREIHENCHGAVISLAWKLRVDDILRLADAGVDGFEIANVAHPNISATMHQALIHICRSRGLVLTVLPTGMAGVAWRGHGQ